MKKLLISLLAIAATINVMADEFSAVAKLELKSADGYSCAMVVKQKAGAKATDCAPINTTNKKVLLYAINGTENDQIYVGENLEGIALGFLTNASTEYTINFSNVSGEKLYLVDAVADKTTEITEGGSYAFTAEANQTIADRFSISKYPPYTFIGDVLTIGELKDGELIYFQYFTYEDGKRVNGIAGTNPKKSFELYTTEGYCEVSYTNKAGVERKFIVNPAPIVTPANN